MARAGCWVAGALLAAMAALVLGQIAVRAAAGISLAWIEEASRAMLVWSAFLVAPYGLRSGANAAIQVFQEALPQPLVRVINLALLGLTVWICAVFFREALALVARGMEIEAATMPIPVAWFYAIAPVGLAALIVVAVELALRELVMLLRPDEDLTIPADLLAPPE